MNGDYGQFLDELSGKPSMGGPGGPVGPGGPGMGGPPHVNRADQGDCAVWVGGLPAHQDDGALHQLFAPYGDVRSGMHACKFVT